MKRNRKPVNYLVPQKSTMMEQYKAIKAGLPEGALLAFRLGDFFEMFYEDAAVLSHVCKLALTNRNGVPMCGFPFHASNTYFSHLLKAGRSVAVCDAMEIPKPEFGQPVRREVTHILSPYDTENRQQS